MPMMSTFGFKAHPELEYMTKPEMTMFKKMLEAGAISFFRTGQCEKCKTEIPKSKKYCSKECAGYEDEEEVYDDREMD